MKTLSILFLLLLPVLTFGQEIRPTHVQANIPGHDQLLFVPTVDCKKEGARLAENDMIKGFHFLLLQSGLAPAVYASDKLFEQKFGVQYSEAGCSGPAKECMMAYNARMFRYLQCNYGRSWWKSIRKDVIGFREWKKSTKLSFKPSNPTTIKTLYHLAGCNDAGKNTTAYALLPESDQLFIFGVSNAQR